MIDLINNITDFSFILKDIITLVLAGWFISSIEVSVHLKSIKKDWTNIIKTFRYILNCIKCCTFWISLIYTGDFTTALICSFIAYLLDLYILKNDITL